jgi:hypothetical protein
VIKVQVFTNGAYAYRKVLHDDDLDHAHLHALLQQILRTIVPKVKYTIELKEDSCSPDERVTHPPLET